MAIVRVWSSSAGMAGGGAPAAARMLTAASAVMWRGDMGDPWFVGVKPDRARQPACAERKRRRRRALPTTERLERTIARLAMTGLSRPKAASGIAASL